jgi:NADH-quinone oxidoreductase subunit C
MDSPLPAPEPVSAAAWRGLDLEAVRQQAGADLLAALADGAEPTAVVARRALRSLAAFLRDERGYQLLLSLTAVDCLPAEPRYQVVYHFAAVAPEVLDGRPESGGGPQYRRLRVKVPVPGDDPVVDSLVPVYAGANWPEREVFDLFGIEFAGHPDLRRILLPESYAGHPLRKDHPLVYEEVAFSHNRERVQAAKPRAGR